MRDRRRSQSCREFVPGASKRLLFLLPRRLRDQGENCSRRGAIAGSHPDLRMSTGSVDPSGPGETESPCHPVEADPADRSAAVTRPCALNLESLWLTEAVRRTQTRLRMPHK